MYRFLRVTLDNLQYGPTLQRASGLATGLPHYSGAGSLHCALRTSPHQNDYS